MATPDLNALGKCAHLTRPDIGAIFDVIACFGCGVAVNGAWWTIRPFVIINAWDAAVGSAHLRPFKGFLLFHGQARWMIRPNLPFRPQM